MTIADATAPLYLARGITAYHHIDDGQTWLRVIDSSGEVFPNEWDEPIAGWSLVHDTIRGVSYYENKKTLECYRAI